MKQKKEVDILFVSPPGSYTHKMMPHYYLYLAAWLEKEGFTCEILDIKPNALIADAPRRLTFNYFSEEKILERFVKGIDKYKPLCIGFCSLVTDYEEVMRLIALLKEKYKDIHIIVGNAQVSFRPQDFIFPGSPVDYAVIGEGEITLTELLNYVKNKNGNPEEIAGIAYLKQNRLYQTARRGLIKDLSVIPFPLPYHKLNMGYYLSPAKGTSGMLRSYAGIFTGRGCPFSCEFCAANVVWKQNLGYMPVRFMPVKKVVSEIVYLKHKYGIESFVVLDDTFSLRKKRVMEFCDELRRRKVNLLWEFQSRVNLIDEELIKIAKNAGCVQIHFGIESGSQKILNRVSKRTKVEDSIKVFDLCSKYKIRATANVIVNLPGEDENDIRLTEKLLERIRPTFVNTAVTAPYPGTALQAELFPDMTKKDYPFLTSFEGRMTKFRMCRHNLDLIEVMQKFRKYNFSSAFSLLPFYDKQFLKVFIRSRRKLQYIIIYFFYKLQDLFTGLNHIFRKAGIDVFKTNILKKENDL